MSEGLPQPLEGPRAMPDPARRQEAAESVATRFTRMMKATLSPLGMWSDPVIVGLETAPLLLALIASHGLEAPEGVRQGLAFLLLAPTLLAIVLTLSWRGARDAVIDWLASLPFPLENMNALLNGLGEEIEVTFARKLPPLDDVRKALDDVHADAFITDTRVETKTMIVRIGVVESKRNPSRSNHARYVRLKAIVERVLVPLSHRAPIETARIK